MYKFWKSESKNIIMLDQYKVLKVYSIDESSAVRTKLCYVFWYIQYTYPLFKTNKIMDAISEDSRRADEMAV